MRRADSPFASSSASISIRVRILDGQTHLRLACTRVRSSQSLLTFWTTDGQTLGKIEAKMLHKKWPRGRRLDRFPMHRMGQEVARSASLRRCSNMAAVGGALDGRWMAAST
jgi:hypothetical protein